MVDPVGFGLAASLARPGGNVTGFTLMTTELNGKRVELLRGAFPAITTVAALVNPAQTTHKMAFAQTESAAQSLGLKITPVSKVGWMTGAKRGLWSVGISLSRPASLACA